MQDEVCVNVDFDVECKSPNTRLAFLGVYDGHGGRKAAIYVRDNLHKCLLDEVKKGTPPEEALKRAYLRTDSDFLRGGNADTSGTTAVSVLIDRKSRKLWVANAGV